MKTFMKLSEALSNSPKNIKRVLPTMSTGFAAHGEIGICKENLYFVKDKDALVEGDYMTDKAFRAEVEILTQGEEYVWDNLNEMWFRRSDEFPGPGDFIQRTGRFDEEWLKSHPES